MIEHMKHVNNLFVRIYLNLGLLYRYLVGVSGAVVAHSLLQLLISASRLRRKALVIPSQRYAWVIYAGDQVKCLFVYDHLQCVMPSLSKRMNSKMHLCCVKDINVFCVMKFLPLIAFHERHHFC